MYEGHPGEINFGLSYWEVTVAAIKMLPAGWGKKKFVHAFASFWDCTVCTPMQLPSALFSVEGHKFSYSTFIPFPLGDFGI